MFHIFYNFLIRREGLSMNLKNLETEQRNPRTMHIDSMSTLDLVRTVNQEDAAVTQAVETALPDIARLIDGICERLQNGGSLYYIGAGTSGRLGVLDASECPPTYGVSPLLVQGIIAGGDSALRDSSESAEDSPKNGKQDLLSHGFTSRDALVGLAASGRTPYVIGALDYASSIGALTGSVACVSHAAISSHAEIPIEAVTGPEVITGSTRMKAGTAQKLILNMISTCTMIKLGKVYQNLMVDVRPSNEKLVERSLGILQECTGCDREKAAELLRASDYHVKTAILMALAALNAEQAREKLTQADGRLATALKS